MKNFVNNAYITGKVYSITGRNDWDNLKKKISRKGVPYIGGVLNVSVNDDNTEVIPVYFTYVQEKTKAGRENSTYTNLSKIIDENRTVESVGNDNAQWVRVDGSLGTNDFFSNRTNDWVASPRIIGSFVHEANPAGGYRNQFEVDSVIGSATENDDGDVVTLHTYGFNFRSQVMPFQFQVHQEKARNFFMDSDISKSNPMFLKLIGNIINRIEVVEETVEDDDDMIFGEDVTTSSVRHVNYWDVTGAKRAGEFGDESTVTAKELKKALDERQERLEQDRAEREAYHQNNTPAPATTTVVEEDDDDDETSFPF